MTRKYYVNFSGYTLKKRVKKVAMALEWVPTTVCSSKVLLGIFSINYVFTIGKIAFNLQAIL